MLYDCICKHLDEHFESARWGYDFLRVVASRQLADASGGGRLHKRHLAAPSASVFVILYQ